MFKTPAVLGKQRVGPLSSTLAFIVKKVVVVLPRMLTCPKVRRWKTRVNPRRVGYPKCRIMNNRDGEREANRAKVTKRARRRSLNSDAAIVN